MENRDDMGSGRIPDPQTDLSRMVGYRPCQLQQPLAAAVVMLLLVAFCCWYCWREVLLAEAEGTSFLVGNSSAAIIFPSGRRSGHGTSGLRWWRRRSSWDHPVSGGIPRSAVDKSSTRSEAGRPNLACSFTRCHVDKRDNLNAKSFKPVLLAWRHTK